MCVQRIHLHRCGAPLSLAVVMEGGNCKKFKDPQAEGEDFGRLVHTQNTDFHGNAPKKGVKLQRTRAKLCLRAARRLLLSGAVGLLVDMSWLGLSRTKAQQP